MGEAPLDADETERWRKAADKGDVDAMTNLGLLAVGAGRLLDDGSRGELQVKVGDEVLFSSYAGETFQVDDQELLLMREDDILAVLED